MQLLLNFIREFLGLNPLVLGMSISEIDISELNEREFVELFWPI